MSEKEILESAIEIALDNGWSPLLIGRDNFYYEVNENATRIVFGFNLNGKKTTPLIQQSTYGVIFSHDFAKAVFQNNEPDIWHLISTDGKRKGNGSKQALEELTGDTFIPLWQYHLQQMVIADEPITYLGENI